jgi:phosphoribosylformimino-5-aminoimidazole carboxamide ribotide isomerase
MPILPVLDLLQGQIVRGIDGRRESYRPIVSKLTPSTEPLSVARAIRAQFGFSEFYLADLDAIQHARSAFDIYRRLQEDGFRLWIDAGLSTSRDDTLEALLAVNVAGIIIGLESVAGPVELKRIAERVGVERTVFSLDLKAGRPLSRAELWRTDDPWNIAEQAFGTISIHRGIVLDLARVGGGAGVGTEELCSRLKRTYPDLQVIAGGGVAGIDDVKRLENVGVDYVLVASALHDGRITPQDISPLSPRERGRG